MDTSDIFTLLGILFGSGGIASVVYTTRTAKTIESAKGVAVDSAQKLNVLDVLTRSLQAENERKDRRIEALEEMVHSRDERLVDLQRQMDQRKQEP